MVALFGFLSRMTGSFAALCAILALLATPSGVFADDAEACRNCCEEGNGT